MQQKQIAFIPWWIAQVLTRNNLKKEDLLSFETISKYLSTEDLVGLVVTGDLSAHFITGGAPCDKTDWICRWLATANDVKSKATITDVQALSANKEVQDDVFARLCSQASTGLPTAGMPEPVTFEITLMGDQGVGVTIKQGFTALQHAKNSSDLLKQVVKQLYVYEDYHQLMARPIGLTYVESLMH